MAKTQKISVKFKPNEDKVSVDNFIDREDKLRDNLEKKLDRLSYEDETFTIDKLIVEWPYNQKPSVAAYIDIDRVWFDPEERGFDFKEEIIKTIEETYPELEKVKTMLEGM